MTKGFIGALLAAVFVVAACNSDRLTVPDLNNPTPEDIANDPIAGLQLAARGIVRQNRLTYDGFVSDMGILGRESYDYFPTDGRSHTHYLAQNPIDPAGFASGGWAPRYQNLRNIFNFLAAVEAAVALTDEQKSAARGFAFTQKALELHYIVAQRDSAGAVLVLNEDPRVLAPFATRTETYDYIIALLDSAKTELLAGGSAFPFTLGTGFNTSGNFSDPAGYLKFNRALYARVSNWRASLRNPACGANGVTCYQQVLTALGESFLDPAGSLQIGVYHVYSTASGDQRNVLNSSVDPDLLPHPSIAPDAPRKADGSFDNRYTAKVRVVFDAKGDSVYRGFVGGPTEGIPTPFKFQIYATQNTPVPFIRNEELILIRAEARYFTGDVVGALADINLIRTTSGGLLPRGPFIDANDFITELLLQRRYSLLWEGHRLIDHRRFNRVHLLPLDFPAHFRHTRQPIPQAECLQREESDLKCPTGLLP